jgi:hypothetical protein
LSVKDRGNKDNNQQTHERVENMLCKRQNERAVHEEMAMRQQGNELGKKKHRISILRPALESHGEPNRQRAVWNIFIKTFQEEMEMRPTIKRNKQRERDKETGDSIPFVKVKMARGGEESGR